MRKWLLRGLIGIAILAGLLLLRATVLAPDPVQVRVVELDRGRVEETITNSRAGTVKARRRAKMSPEIGGQVVKIPVREGDRVEAGDLLLELDASAQRARVDLAARDAEAAAAERERACLAAERAGRELQRVDRLASENIVSTDLLDQIASGKQTADAVCNTARAQVARAAAALRVAETELAKTRLLAPFDGLVADIAAEVGEWVTPSPPALPVPPVFDILDPDSLYVSAPMDEVDAASLAPGQPCRLTVDSHRGRDFEATLDRVAPYVLDVEQQNRTVEIEVAFGPDAAGARLRAGTSADVEVILEVREDVPRVPTAALMEGHRILVVVGDRLEERKLEIGLRNWDYSEVLSGAEPGDAVVVSLDREEVKAGALVEIENSSPDG